VFINIVIIGTMVNSLHYYYYYYYYYKPFKCLQSHTEMGIWSAVSRWWPGEEEQPDVL